MSRSDRQGRKPPNAQSAQRFAGETRDVVVPGTQDAARMEALLKLDQTLQELEADLGAAGFAAAGRFEAEAAPQLCALERRLFEVECEWAREVRAPREHPVLPVLIGWAERLRRIDAVEQAAEAGALAAALLCRSLRQRERLVHEAREVQGTGWAGEATEGLRDRIFDALVATEEVRHGVEGRAERHGPASRLETRTVVEEARRVQAVLRAELKTCVEASPPDEHRRDEWAGRLVDHADEALVASLEVDVDVGARVLGEGHRALLWHVEHIERERREGGAVRRRRLTRRMRRLRAEQLELGLQAKLEEVFGRRNVQLWERMVFLSIALVMGLLVASVWYGGSSWLLWTDTAVCAFLLLDFFVKAAFVRFSPVWLKRHILTDFLPAVPIGLFAVHGTSGELAPLLKALRFQKVARSLRLLLPLIRLYRALTFFLRGLDRIVRQNARLLMGEALLFPTAVERREARDGLGSLEARLWAVRSKVDRLFDRRLESADEAQRVGLAAMRLEGFQRASNAEVPLTDAFLDPRAGRRAGLPLAEDLLGYLSRVRSEEVEGRLGRDAVSRLARGARIVSGSPLRHAPLVGRWVPVDARGLSDRRVAARVLREASRSAAALNRAILWWADLKGTLTPGELVGRVGSTLVARSARPAVRLLAIGGAYLMLRIVLHGFGFEPDDAVMLAAGETEGSGEVLDTVPGSGVADDRRDLTGLRGLVVEVFAIVNRLTGVVLVVLGSICLAFLGIGAWLQRLARDTTVFHEQVARAQFLHLTESIKARARLADAALLEERVFSPERVLRPRSRSLEAAERDEDRFIRGLERFMTAGVSPPSSDVGFDPVSRAVMLYRDLLDGALLVHSDTRATSQLLGNLALQRMITHAGRVDATMRRTLRGLDLERRRTFLSGPYLWFHSITRALSSRSARLIVDYNAHAIPLVELDRTSPEGRRRYEAWLDRDSRKGGAGGSGDSVRASAKGNAAQLTTAFTALHFLDASPARDAEIAARFGAQVLERLRADRRSLVRTVLGTSPLHELPLESRVLNVRLLYADWIEGGRVWLAPIRLFGLGCRAAILAGRVLARSVGTIRRPEEALGDGESGAADFHVASRKIDRMRGPAALAAAELRAILDPEYCGLLLPGMGTRSESTVSEAQVWADADYLGAGAVLRDRLAAHSARASRCLTLLERECASGLLERLSVALGVRIDQDPESLRALALILVADDDGIRSDLFATEIFEEAICDSLRFGLPRSRGLMSFRLRLRFERWWHRSGGREVLMLVATRAGVLGGSTMGDCREPSFGTARSERARARRVKRAAWATLVADVDGARRAFDSVRGGEAGRRAARNAAESRLADALRHPARITEQIVTLRAIQTLSLVDVREYRRHVWELGEYAAEGDPGGVLLEIPRRTVG